MDLDRGHLARQFTSGGTAHAVGHEEEHPSIADLVDFAARLANRFPTIEVGDQEGVLVVVASPPAVGDSV